MGSIFDACSACEFLVGGREEGIHLVAGDEGCCAEGDGQRGGIRGGDVIVETGLGTPAGNLHGKEGGYDGWSEVVQGSVDVPAVEAGVGEVEVGGDGGCVEGAVVWVAEGDVGEAFVGGDEAVSDYLHLGLVGDGFEIGVENGALGVEGLAVAVGGGGGVKAVGEFELGFGGNVGLVLEDDDLVGEEGVADYVKVGIKEVTDFTGDLPIMCSMQCHFATWTY